MSSVEITKKDDRPHVVHVIYELGTGGLENGLVNIINRMSAYRHSIVCLTRSGVFADRITADVDIYELNKKAGHDIGMFWRLWRLLCRLRPAIVHTRNLAALETQILGLLMPRVKRVHGEHGRDMDDLDGSNPRYRFLRRIMRPLVHRYITVSEDLASYLRSTIAVPEAKIRQIYNGVDTQKFSAVKGAAVDDLPVSFIGDVTVIGTVGRLAAVKDQPTLISAFARICHQYPVRLLIVGDGPQRALLERTIDECAIREKVFMAGDRSDVPALLGVMDIFVLPSLAEGISNTVLEAMASGLPVIATKTGGNPELVRNEENGLLVPVGDVEALAAALARLLANSDQVDQMGANARSRVKQEFDWSRTVARYQGVYDELLKRV